MRIVFWGTPALTVPYLECIDETHQLVAVVTQPDRRRGRGPKVSPSAAKQAAEARAGIVLQPESLQEPEFLRQLAEANAQVFVVVAYGRILPGPIIQMPTEAAINVHYSLLPQLRGAAPVQHALLQGLTETGVTVQYISEELDAGDVIGQQSLSIEPDDNTATLTARLTELGVGLLDEALDLLEAGRVPRTAQDENQATWAPRLSKEDGMIDWSRPAREIVNQVRACWPWPGAVCEASGEKLKISRAAVVSAENYRTGGCGIIVEIRPKQGLVVITSQDAVLIKEVQPAGRRIMPASAYLSGAHLPVGDRLR